MNETNLDKIAGALAEAQKEMQNPGFDSQNPHFRSKFASLASVRNAVVPVLASHGISLSQDLQTTERGIACITILTHSSGQQMRFGPLEMPASKTDAQGFGSAATYARRYSLMAVAGVVGDEDDDGNAAAASTNPTKQVAQKVVEANVKPTAGAFDSLTPERKSKIVDMANAVLEKYAESTVMAYSMYVQFREKLAEHTEAKVALWEKLPSHVRTQFTKHEKEGAAAQPA